LVARWIVALVAASAAIAVAAIVFTQAPVPGTDEAPWIDVREVEGSFSSPYVREFQLVNGTWPNGMLVDGNGAVWTVGAKSRSLVSFDPETNRARSHPIPVDSDSPQLVMVWAMSEGKDGSILFSGIGGRPLWRFDPQTEKFQLIDSPSSVPLQMTVDQDRIWYTLPSGVVGVVQRDEVKEVETGGDSFPSGIFVQNRTLWVTKALEGKIAEFKVSYDGARVAGFTEVAQYPVQETLITPTDIIVSDGSAWVTEHNTSFVTKYDTGTDTVTRYPTSLHPVHVSTLPYWLEHGDRGIWFNEHRGNRIGFLDLSTHTLTEYEIPTRNPEAGGIANALTIHIDPADKNKLWFTEFTEDRIGYVDRSVPVPFDIRADDRLIIEEGQAARISIEVTRKPGVELFNNTLSFGVSSSVTVSGVLANATASFAPEYVDLSAADSQDVVLEIADQGMPKELHMLAISATDGAVVRTVYLEMVVR
jgi:streptogramin lyase